MKAKALGLLVLPLACCATVSPARIDEIAAWLPERPAADGARITDRAAWDRLAATPHGAREVKAAAALLSRPVPDAPDAEYLEFSQNGNRSRYQTSLFRRMGGFRRLVVAECLEDRGRFIPKIADYVDAFAAQRSWTLPAHDGALTCFNGAPHVDLVSGELSLTFAFCSDWLGDRLPPRAPRSAPRSNAAPSGPTSITRAACARFRATGGCTPATIGTASATPASCAPPSRSWKTAACAPSSSPSPRRACPLR